jgi:tetratricopeptide (TPR) repeat protein
MSEAEEFWKQFGANYPVLTPYEQALYRVERARFEGDWPTYLDGAKTQYSISQSFEGLTFLADAETRVHHGSAAERLHREIKELAAKPLAGNLAINAALSLVTLSEIHHETGRFDEQLDDARLGQTRYVNDGRFLLAEIGARIGLDQLSGVDDVLRRAEADEQLLRGGVTPGSAMTRAASELRAHGHREASVKTAERAVQFFKGRMTGKAVTPDSRAALAVALMRAEQWPAAHAAWQALVHDVPAELEYLGMLGVTAARLGQKDDARRIAGQLAELTRPYLLGKQHYERARVLAALGDADNAVMALRQAFKEGQFWTYGTIHRDLAFEPIRDFPPFLEFLKSKD